MTPKAVNVGILGAGGAAGLHYPGYKAAGARLLAIADADPVALELRQREWGIPRGYARYEELLADPEIEAVSVCLPNHLHMPATVMAAEAGKHVLCEKPISLTLERAETMIAACRDAGVVLQIGHHMRSDGAALRAKELIDGGRLGRITYIRLRQAHDWAGGAIRGSFGLLAHSGGGTLIDNGVHLLDLAHYFGGPVRQVFAQTAKLAYDIEVEDTAQVSLSFMSGALGSVECAWTATGWENSFAIYGTKGSLEYSNRWGEPVLQHSFRSSPGTAWDRPDVASYRFAGLDGHARSILSFLAAVRGEGEVVCSGEDGLEAVRLVLAAYQSARQGAPVPLGPAELAGPT